MFDHATLISHYYYIMGESVGCHGISEDATLHSFYCFNLYRTHSKHAQEKFKMPKEFSRFTVHRRVIEEAARSSKKQPQNNFSF